MSEPSSAPELGNPRDHLANERTFLAWLRTGIALIVFGFAIGRFTFALREFIQAQGRTSPTSGLSVWLGALAIVAGVALSMTGLGRYRQTRAQLESGRFKAGGSIIDLVAILTATMGLAMVGYLVYIE